MTGYGTAAGDGEQPAVTVTVRSLNHRYLDVSVHLPRQLLPMETDVRRLLQGRLHRGRVELSVHGAARGGDAEPVLANHGLIAGLLRSLREAQAEHSLPGEVRIADLMRFPGAFETQEPVSGLDDQRRQQVLSLVDRAVEGLERMRAAEGTRLKEALLAALEAVAAATGAIEALVAQERPSRTESLRSRASALKEELGLDEARLYQEVVRLVDRQDVTEELQRLASHVAQARQIVEAGGPCGKRLDFLAQEMGREANTIGSKSDSAALAQQVVELKSELERFREQLQNVE